MKHKKHHSDPMVGGTSDHESKAWGHGQHANMPQEVKMSAYPKMPHKELDSIDDTEGRLETDAKHAERGDRKSLERGMY